jgi:hypothetical protein
LVRASWRFAREEIELDPKGIEPEKAMLFWTRWRLKAGLPRHVYFRKYPEGDGPIWVDFHNPLSLMALQHQLAPLQNGEQVVFEEMLPTPEDALTPRAALFRGILRWSQSSS